MILLVLDAKDVPVHKLHTNLKFISISLLLLKYSFSFSLLSQRYLLNLSRFLDLHFFCSKSIILKNVLNLFFPHNIFFYKVFFTRFAIVMETNFLLVIFTKIRFQRNNSTFRTFLHQIIIKKSSKELLIRL